jgi:Outer membrane protein beta-barrel domain
MKFFLLIFITLAISLSAISQVEFGLFAGPQITSTHYTIYNIKQKNDPKFGFQAGVGLKVPFDINLSFAPSAFYSLKGYKVTFTQFAFPPDTTAIDNNTTIHSFELAALLQYDLGKKSDHFFIKAGPSLDFQLFGKEKFNLTDGTSVNRNMKFSFGDYGHYSASILTQFGYETGSGLIIFAQYSHGLSSINNADGGPQIRHRVFGISIGKYLNRKKITIDTKNKE